MLVLRNGILMLGVLMSVVRAGSLETPHAHPVRENPVRENPVREARPTIEAEVLANVLGQVMGSETVASLDLPDAFLYRVVDRVIRDSYRQNRHIVLFDRTNAPRNRTSGHAADVEEGVRPTLRGFRHPSNVIDAPVDPNQHRAYIVINQSLARDGLLATLVLAIDAAGADIFPSDRDAQMAWLYAAGLPVDLLESFTTQDGLRGMQIVEAVKRRLMAGESTDSVRETMQHAAFAWKKEHPFRVAPENGDRPLGAMRFQLTRGTYWNGSGAGGCLDVARQMVGHNRGLDLLIGIQRRHLPAMQRLARMWSLDLESDATTVTSPTALAQWAQDNGKAGWITDGENAAQHTALATLTPRYASRREDGSMYIATESAVMDRFAEAGHTVTRSRLLFQGGNMLAITDPKTGRRMLLIGEAEVYRNTALGLTQDQAVDAIASEFDVDEVLVLPAASFHLDYAMTVRTIDGKLVAFVNDEIAAAKMIVATAAKPLLDMGVIDTNQYNHVVEWLKTGHVGEAIDLLDGELASRFSSERRISEAATHAFSATPTDSGVGNIQLFFVAMDVLRADTIRTDSARADSEQSNTTRETRKDDRFTAAYLRAMHRSRVDTTALHNRLMSAGFTIVRIPSMSQGDRGMNYLNGIHDAQRYFMPARGGLFGDLDVEARDAFQKACGTNVSILPILSAESQRRGGAIHCSVSAFPRYTTTTKGGDPKSQLRQKLTQAVTGWQPTTSGQEH